MAVIDEKEICRNFKEAKDKAGMILILSQLNDCSREEIIQVLEKNGFEDPRKNDKKKPKVQMPETVKNALVEKMEFIDRQIKELEKQYKEIATYIGNS